MGDVIAMSRYAPATGFSHIAAVEAYWTALKGDRLVPLRAEVDPRGIEGSLEQAFILEQVAPGVARLRIAGAHLGDLMGMEVRGMPLTALFAAGARRHLAATIESVCAAPLVASLSLRAEDGNGRPALEGRMILLPMASEHGEVNRILGCLDTRGAVGRAPRRFTILGCRLTQIVEAESDEADGRCPPAALHAAALRPAPAAGFAEGTGPFRGKAAAPHLRLVRNEG